MSIPITSPEEKKEIVAGIKASDLGVAKIDPENVIVTKTGVAEITTTVQAPILEKTVDKALSSATEESAKQVLNEIKQSVSSGSSSPVSVSSTIEVFEIKEKTTGQTTFASKITLTLKPDKDLKDVNIVEVIPKSSAKNIADVIFLGEKPKVLQADPIVQWTFDDVKKDETKDLSYQVAKKIETVEANTIAAAAVAPSVPAKGNPVTIYIVAILAIAAAVIYFRFFKKSSGTKSRR